MNIEERILRLTYENRKLYNVVMELNTKCNWKCKHCYIPEHVDDGLELEQVYAILEQLREEGCFEITFTGGEIFCRKDIIKIIKKAREMCFKVTLFTNASLLTEEVIKELAQEYISEISCTVFSLKSDIHDYITGIKGSLDKTLKNLEVIKKYKIPATVKTIVMSVNKDEVKDIADYCKRNGFKYNIDHDVFAKKDGNKEPFELRLNKCQLENKLKEYDDIRGYVPRQHEPDEFVCAGIQNALFIDCKGIVYPCNKFLFPIGDLKRQTIHEIWNKSDELKRIQDMRWKDLKKCVTCKISKYCIHCPGTAFLEDGDEYDKSSLACEKAEIRYNIYEGTI